MAKERQSFWGHVLKWEPGLSFGQWVADRIANNWGSLAIGGTTLSAAGITGWLASGAEWLNAYGALGWWLAALLGALLGVVIAAGFAWMRYQWVRARAIQRWKDAVDTVNPMAPEYHTQRINLSDLVHPFTRRIAKKRFIDCDLVGPINVAFLGSVHLQGMGFINCDIVVTKRGVRFFNVVVVQDVVVLNGSMSAATIYIAPEMVPSFQAMGAQFVSYLPPPEAPEKP